MISKLRIIQCMCLSTLIMNVSFAEDSCFPYIPQPLDISSMIAPAKSDPIIHHTYILPATPATSQWGVFDSSQKPVLTIKPGDTVAIETMAASDNQVVPGTTVDQIIQMQNAVKNRGPHTLTGPIFVEGAEPGDVLKIHFNKILPRSYASNDSVPGKGLFPKEFPDPQVKYFYLDLKKMQMQFAPGIIVPLSPFPGTIGVARATPGSYSSGPPGNFGGNMDLREMTEGTTLYLPVFMKGGLLWTGDSHAGQGNGEIDLTAIETAFAEFNVTIDLIKQQPLAWPRVETPTAWIAMGYDTDLNKALDILKDETVKLIMDKRKVSKDQATKIMYETWNCPIAEVVNGVQGVYCMLPKNSNAPKPKPLLLADDAKFFVTVGKDVDVEKAMKIASMAMINKVSETKKLSRMDVYILASLTMDCRIAPYHSGEKEVHCTMDKGMWV